MQLHSISDIEFLISAIILSHLLHAQSVSSLPCKVCNSQLSRDGATTYIIQFLKLYV